MRSDHLPFRSDYSVHKSWDAYFKAVDSGVPSQSAFVLPPTLASSADGAPASASAGISSAAAGDAATKRLAISHLIRAFQVSGHQAAQLDPLKLRNETVADIEELDPEKYGFSPAELDAPLDSRGIDAFTGFLGTAIPGGTTLRALLELLRATYCGTVGWEYMHMTSREKCNWIRKKIEVATPEVLSAERKLQVFERLARAVNFESFVNSKFNTVKRFGLEGAEGLIPGLLALIDKSSELGVKSVVFGMPHRGRISVLANVFNKPREALFKEFKGKNVDVKVYSEKSAAGDWTPQGDVKYHLGYSRDATNPDGRTMHLVLLPNPSHLEAVNTVVIGKVRAKQDALAAKAQKAGEPTPSGGAVMGILLHGDAAFAGQGIVYETLLLSRLRGYGTSGTIHVIVNNQVGFTTDPIDARSTRYCTDLGKAFDVPVFHVNADDAEAVTRVFELAAEYRQQFSSDVIIDLIGHRKQGHNELDNADFTQPIVSRASKVHPTSLALYTAQLDAEKVASAEELQRRSDVVMNEYKDAFAVAEQMPSGPHPKDDQGLQGNWKGFLSPEKMSLKQATAIPLAKVAEVVEPLYKVLPPGFAVHPTITKIRADKAKALADGEGIDWATGESLAFASLLDEGHVVRLSGQDVERGTFSHRNAVLHDQVTNAVYTPMKNVKGGENFTVINSPLSEFGVMGFEFGYALESPYQLVMWEAQFGAYAAATFRAIAVRQYLLPPLMSH